MSVVVKQTQGHRSFAVGCAPGVVFTVQMIPGVHAKLTAALRPKLSGDSDCGGFKIKEERKIDSWSFLIQLHWTWGSYRKISNQVTLPLPRDQRRPPQTERGHNNNSPKEQNLKTAAYDKVLKYKILSMNKVLQIWIIYYAYWYCNCNSFLLIHQNICCMCGSCTLIFYEYIPEIHYHSKVWSQYVFFFF